MHFIRLSGWLRHSFAQLITLRDIDGIGQNWEDSNISSNAQLFEVDHTVRVQPFEMRDDVVVSCTAGFCITAPLLSSAHEPPTNDTGGPLTSSKSFSLA